MAKARAVRSFSDALLPRIGLLLSESSRRIIPILQRIAPLCRISSSNSRQRIACYTNTPPLSLQPTGYGHTQTRRYASSSADLKRTPLYDLHISAGAKMVPFGGYSMPLEYATQSHRDSHLWTRSHASLFDVSHMVQHMVSGPSACDFLMRITPSSLDTLAQNTSTLSCLLATDPAGGMVDDTVITRLGEDSFYFVTNAGTRDADLTFLSSELTRFLDAAALTDDAINHRVLMSHSLLALQGPLAASVLQDLVYTDPDDPPPKSASANLADLNNLPFSHSCSLQLILADSTTTPPLLVSRTGYTGEDGFEISIPSKHGDVSGLATLLAKTLVQDDSKVRWAGLAARDSLRLEAGMCLYGHDISLNTTPPEAGLGWVVAKERRADEPGKGKATFNGASRILEQLAKPSTMGRRRVGLEVEKGPAAREGAEIVDERGGKVVGVVTSGCPSPTLEGKNIAMALVNNGLHKRGTKLGVKMRKGVRQAEVVKMPFVESKFYRPQK